jgi:cbb3-type cytochrome oxidase subunit 1
VIATVHWGVVAVAVGVTARQYLVWPLRLRALRRHLRVELRTYLLRWLGPMASGAAACGCGFVLSQVWRPGGGISEAAYIVAQVIVVSGLYVGTLRYTASDSYQELVGIPAGLIARRRGGAEAVAG